MKLSFKRAGGLLLAATVAIVSGFAGAGIAQADNGTVISISQTNDYTATHTSIKVGDTAHITLKVVNHGTVTITDIILSVDVDYEGSAAEEPDIKCPSGYTLEAGKSMECTSEYTVVAGDVDRGYVLIPYQVVGMAGKTEVSDLTSVKLGGEPAPNPAKPAVKIVNDSVDKATAHPGDTLTYTFTIQNSGTEALSGLSVDIVQFTGAPEPKTAACDSTTDVDKLTLAAGKTVTCKVTYKVTDADVKTATVSFQVQVSGKAGTATVTAKSQVLTTKVTKANVTASTGGSVSTFAAAAALGVLVMLAGAGVLVLARRRQQA